MNPSPPTAASALREYFRRDQASGVSPPDLSKVCTYAEYIVHARGKRTQFTSVSLDPDKIRDLEGDALYRLRRDLVSERGHELIEHEKLIEELRKIAREGSRGERLLATRAHGYAKGRREGLVEWAFDISRIQHKDRISLASRWVQDFFVKVGS